MRVYQISDKAQRNLDELDRQYKRIQRMLILRYVSIGVIFAMVVLVIWLWM